jgi:hypothetical protein
MIANEVKYVVAMQDTAYFGKTLFAMEVTDMTEASGYNS